MSLAFNRSLTPSVFVFLTQVGACEGSPSSHHEPSPEGLGPASPVHETPPVGADDQQAQAGEALATPRTGVTPSSPSGAGRPACFYADPLRSADIVTSLGTLAEARAVLAAQLASSEPVALHWADPVGEDSALEIRLVRWDTEALGEYPGGTCLMLSGTFHVSTADGLLDAEVQGGITNLGFEAALRDPAELAALDQRFGASLRVLEMYVGPSGGRIVLSAFGSPSDSGPMLDVSDVEPFPISTVEMAGPIGGARGYRVFCDFEQAVTDRAQFDPELVAAANAFEAALASEPFTLSWYKGGLQAHEGGAVQTTTLQLRVVHGGDQLRRDPARARCVEIPYVLHASTGDGQLDLDIPGTFDGESFVGDLARVEPLAPLIPLEMPAPLRGILSFWPAYPSGDVAVEAVVSAGPQEHSEVEVALFAPPREE